MNDIKIFESSEFGAVRTLVIDGETWYVGKDVADVLGLANHRSTLFKLVKPENKRRIIIGEHQNGDKHSCLVNADGVRSIAIRSKKAPTEAVKWLIEEVIPMATVNETEIQRAEAVDVANTNVTIFENSEFGELGLIVIDGKEYFPATQCAKILGYADPYKAIKQHCRSDGWVNRPGVSHTTNQYGVTSQQTTEIKYINEGNLYRLIVSSKLPSAERFEHWVFDEVLPSIRKHGVYAVDDLINNPDAMIRALTALKEERAKNKTLTDTIAVQSQQIAELQPKASYFDVVINCKDLVSISVIAKDFGKSAKWLNEYLHMKKVQYKQGNTWLLYAKYAEQGYTSTKTTIYNGSEGSVHTSVHTYWTQKGRLFIYNLLKADGYVPLIERGDEEDDK